MRRIPDGIVRPSLGAVCLVLTMSTTACGDASSSSGGSGDSSLPSSSESAASSASPGAAADRTCGDGSFETQVVRAARDVRVTVPADWQLKAGKGGAAFGLYPPDRDAGDGYVVVQQADQTIDQAVDYALQSTVQAAEQTSEQDLDLPGFEAARMVTFGYDDNDDTYAVDVVAVADGLRVVVDLTREGDPDEQAVAESCLSTLERG